MVERANSGSERWIDERNPLTDVKVSLVELTMQQKDALNVLLTGRSESGFSELIKRIESKDPHHLMPQSPQGEAKPMRASDIAVLKEWIKEGAVYRPHWAFDKPHRSALPSATQTDGRANNPIGAFILARLTKAGLHPSPEARKEVFARAMFSCSRCALVKATCCS